MTCNPSQIIMTFLYVLPYYGIGKNVEYFGSIMFSFRFIALTIYQIQGAFLIIDFVFSWFFYFLEFLAKPTFSYMIIYAKTHNFVNYRFLGWVRCGKSTLIHFILKAHLQAEPKVYKWQSGMGLMYWTYILRILKKTCGAYLTFHLNWPWL